MWQDIKETKMENINQHREIITKKAEHFKKSGRTVHIDLVSGKWENGTIKEIGADFLILELTEKGKKRFGINTRLFFFLEIKDIEEYIIGDKNE